MSGIFLGEIQGFSYDFTTGYAFEDFVVNIERAELTRAGQEIAVKPRVFDLLHMLVQHRDRVLRKDELIDLIWEGRIISDAAISLRVDAP